jgi:dTDP-4-amino-4,6-dideoxygalactose transaminase
MRRVYDSQWYILGPEVAQFEQAYSELSGVNYTIGVGTGAAVPRYRPRR